jgi:hypothetical protein
VQSQCLGQGRDAELGIEHAHERAIGGERAGPIARPCRDADQVRSRRLRERIGGDASTGVQERGVEVVSRRFVPDDAGEGLRQLGAQALGGSRLPLVERGTVAQRESVEESFGRQLDGRVPGRGILRSGAAAEVDDVARRPVAVPPNSRGRDDEGRTDRGRRGQRATQNRTGTRAIELGPQRGGERIARETVLGVGRERQHRHRLAGVEPDRDAVDGGARGAEQAEHEHAAASGRSRHGQQGHYAFRSAETMANRNASGTGRRGPWWASPTSQEDA